VIRDEIMGFPLEIKAAVGETGKFSGYAAVFGGVDQIGDSVLPSAFDETLAELKVAGRKMPMHLNHGLPQLGGRRGVGAFDVLSTDSKGLFVEGAMVGMNTDTGRYLFEQVKSGAMGGLSIGFRVRPGGEVRHFEARNGVRRTLKSVTLREISIVDDPCDTQARITEIKSALGMFKTLSERAAAGEDIKFREARDELREKLGLSISQAEGIAPLVLKCLTTRESDEAKATNDEAAAAVADLRGFLGKFSLSL
jgi:HK97 family phage prohead protease